MGSQPNLKKRFAAVGKKCSMLYRCERDIKSCMWETRYKAKTLKVIYTEWICLEFKHLGQNGYWIENIVITQWHLYVLKNYQDNGDSFWKMKGLGQT